VLDEVGIAAHVIAVTMCVEDSCQMEALFLQDAQKESARTLPYACINQERLLYITHNETDVARPRQVVDVVMDVLQTQNLVLFAKC
jgi:hypothetical protein